VTAVGGPASRWPAGTAPLDTRPASSTATRDTQGGRIVPSIEGKDIKRVVVACEAGMGSSVLLTTQLGQKLKPYGVEVTHSPVNRLNDDTADVVLCHQGLSSRARQAAPNSVIIPFSLFMGDPAFARIEAAVRDGSTIDG
jgi:galactose PTS system EIIB component